MSATTCSIGLKLLLKVSELMINVLRLNYHHLCSSFSFFFLPAAAANHPYFKPCEMMQVFSLRLSNPIDHPVDIYGSFSVRDGWEPLPNYLFKRSRDDPAMIPEVSDTCHYHELKLHKKKTRTLIGITNRFIQAYLVLTE